MQFSRVPRRDILLLHLTTQMSLQSGVKEGMTHKFHITLGSATIETNGVRNQNGHQFGGKWEVA